MRSLKSGNQKESESDGDGVFRNRDDDIRDAQGANQPDARVISAECSGNSADCAG
jgi:hypothetical protein